MIRWQTYLTRHGMRTHALAAAGGIAAACVIGGLAWWAVADRSASVTHVASKRPTSTLAFSDETLALGVTTEHRQGDDHLTGLDETLGSGACALDYDNDGAMDLFIVNGSGDTRYYGRRHWWQRGSGHALLHDRGDGHFDDVTETALATHPTRGSGCVATDLDNDGNTDVLVTGMGENLLLRNLGNGKFVDITEQSGLKGQGWQTAAAVADVDGDGLLDIYVGRLIAFQKGGRIYEPGSQYKQDVSGAFNPALYPAQANSLYRNRGGMKFEDVAADAGVANPDGRTLGAVWLDLDGDHRPDLIVTNAAGTGSTVVFHNDGKWKFSSLGTDTRLQNAAGSRAATVADLDNDGVPEIVMTATNGAQSGVFVRQSSVSGAPVFSDRGRQWKFARDAFSGFSPWSALAADFDNDGWVDVFVGNGLAIPDPDVPRLTVGQPKQIWLNSRHGTLEPQTFAAMDALNDRQSARGAVAADFDNDGDIDLYVVHNNDLGQLLINQSGGTHWVGLRLHDTAGNRDAIGASVELDAEDGAQYRWRVTSEGFMSGSDPRLHFGLGASSFIRRAIVTWPDGRRSTFKDIPVDRYVTLTRGEKAKPDEQKVRPATDYASLTHLVIREREPALRADYLRLLVEARGLEASLGEVRESLTDPDANVRKASVEILAAHPGTTSLAVLLDSLRDRDPGIVVAAVGAVCPYEEEDAARWLLRLFAHPDAGVRTAVADCFTGYFHEEEAVVHRKYLALPYLVEALSDGDARVQIAAARALGEAERFRGVPPLLELAKATSSENVRAEAIRALGLIRDRQATGDLLALLHSRVLLDEPRALAQMLIALRRLDYGALHSVTSDFAGARGDFVGMTARPRLAALAAMLEVEDGVVFPRTEIAALARRCYDKLAASRVADEATALAFIDVLREANDVSSIPLLTALADSGSRATVKAAALRALGTIDPAQAGKYVERGLDAADAEVGRRLLVDLKDTRVDLSDRVLIAALTRTDTRAGVAAIALRVRSPAAADTLMKIVTNIATGPKARAEALEALARSPFKFALPADAYATTDDALGRAVVRYELSRLPSLVVSRTAPPIVGRLLAMRAAGARLAVLDSLAARQEFWAKNQVLAVLKESRDQALRTHVLSLLAASALQGSQVLESISTDRTDPLRIDALHRLEGRPGSSAEQVLLGVLRDATDDPKARVVAAHRLVGRLGPEVLQMLARATGDGVRATARAD
jgi:HEAT repeat protein